MFIFYRKALLPRLSGANRRRDFVRVAACSTFRLDELASRQSRFESRQCSDRLGPDFRRGQSGDKQNYIISTNTANVTVITPAPTNAIPLNTTVAPLAGNSTSNNTPTAPQPRNIYFQIDTTNGTWTRATNTGSTATTLTATATPATLQNGIHILYFYAADGSDATSINPLFANGDKGGKLFDGCAPESSSVIGGINAYQFLVAPAAPTAANVTVGGKVLTDSGQGISRVSVILTDPNGTARSITTNSFGNYRFEDVEVGQTYVVSVSHRKYQFATPSQIVQIDDARDDLNFTASQ